MSLSNEGTTALGQLRRFWILLLILLSAFPCHGTAISGTVKTTAGVPIPNADVTAVVAARHFGAVTDASGAYSISITFSATYNVTAAQSGYTFTPASTNVAVTVGGPDVIIDFTTPATVPSATSYYGATATAFSETLYGYANPDGAATTVWFDYGTTTNYGSTSTATNIGSGTASVLVGISVTNLLPGTPYHFQAVASNSFGTVFGADVTFTTLSGIPSVATLPPTNGGATSMTLQGSVNPNGASATAWFDFGTTTNYEFPPVIQNVGNGTTTINFSQAVIGLTTGTTYHYRAAAMTTFGTNYGADVVFTPLFSDVSPPLPGIIYSSVAWGDYNNDGLLDILLTGSTGTSVVSQVWLNTGNGFSNINAGLPGVRSGSVAWGDYDNDGRLDILLTGLSATGAIAQVWRNTGNGFSNINAGLPGVYSSSVAWGDYDNDGRLDILLTGSPDGDFPSAIAQVWRNTGNGFSNINAALPGVVFASAAWGDYDNDGWLDILLTGRGVNGDSITQVWRNTGNGFSNINATLTPIAYGSAAWGDYDNDGRLDLLLVGVSNLGPGGTVTEVWRNTGRGFTNINAGLPALSFGSSGVWGDYDNDGRPDILLSGSGPAGHLTQIFRNNGDGTFTPVNPGLPQTAYGSIAWGDFDNAGRLDILQTGQTDSSLSVSRLWRNNTPVTNSPPLAPAGLQVTVSNNAALLMWNPASDNQTPAAGLSYNLRIGTTPGGSDILAPMSDANGLRRVPQLGNVNQSLVLPFYNYTPGRLYYWSVQAVDSAFSGSAFAVDRTFKLLPVLVPATSTNIIPGDLNGDGIVDQNELNMVLSNYWPYSPWVYMTNTAGLGQTNIQFALTNATAWNFSVLVSTDLVDWSFLGPAYPMYQFVDPFATNTPQRYYRLRWP